MPQSGTLTGTITPTSGAVQYIYTTGYVYNGSSWLPEPIVGNQPYPGVFQHRIYAYSPELSPRIFTRRHHLRRGMGLDL